ncbi:hypothetical protein L211DRAFT_835425, partial [Terfezia boudieri ATCC MYA-4762]
PRHCHTSNIDRARPPILPCLHRRDSAMPPALRECHASGVEIVPCLRCRECHASAVEAVPRLRCRDSCLPPPSSLPCLRRPACRTSAAQPPMPLLSTVPCLHCLGWLASAVKHAMPPPSSMPYLRRPACHASAAQPPMPSLL